jgi:hypothetical protein
MSVQDRLEIMPEYKDPNYSKKVQYDALRRADFRTMPGIVSIAIASSV